MPFYILQLCFSSWYWWRVTNIHVACVIVDTLFDIFCECAELNPEPIDGEYHSFILNWTMFWLSDFSWCCINYVFFFSCISFNFLCMLSSGEEEEHNWIFSADQMVDEVAGIGWTVKIDACVFVLLMYTFLTCLYFQRKAIISLKIQPTQLVIQMGIMT